VASGATRALRGWALGGAIRRRLRAVDAWLFAPGTDRRVAAVRIGLSAILAERLFRPVYGALATQPAPLFQPRSFMHLFASMPGHGVVLALQVIGVTAAILAAAGLRARVTLPVAWLCGMVLIGMTTSLGKVAHNDVPLLLCMVPLLAAATSDAWSVDAFLARRRGDGHPARGPRRSVRYGWPVHTGMVVMAGAYFFAGLAKLVFSGPAWVLSDNVRWLLYASSDAHAVPNGFALLIAGRPWLAHLVAATTLVLETAFPVVLWRPHAAWVFLPGVVLVHVAIWRAMGLDYSAWIGTAVVVFVDWEAVGRTLRPATRVIGRRTRSLPGPA
jgi:hypothetical protein